MGWKEMNLWVKYSKNRFGNCDSYILLKVQEDRFCSNAKQHFQQQGGSNTFLLKLYCSDLLPNRMELCKVLEVFAFLENTAANKLAMLDLFGRQCSNVLF